MRRILFLFIFFLSWTILRAEKYVVVAGIADYKTICDLILPAKDAQAIAELYKKHTKNVILLTGKYATKTRVLSALKQQFARAGKDDEIVFCFSGHGYPGGFCPYDMTAQSTTSGISHKEILHILKQSKAAKKMVFADACYSGSLRTNSQTSEEQIKETDILFFLSSRTGETSIESPFMANGYFTTYLLRGLRGGADTDRNRKITAKELFRFVSEGVKEKSKNQQHPVMWGKFPDNLVLMEW